MFTRFPRILVLAVVGVLVLGIAVASAWNLTKTTKRTAVSTAAVYGFSDPTLLNDTAAVQVSQLEAMKAMGMTSVRFDANWYWAQPNGPGTYDWATLDQTMASVRQVGLTADLIIDGCPAWAAVPAAAGQEFAAPASSAALATYAAAIAARYGPEGAKYFEIGNEENTQGSWEPGPNPAAYTADLKASYTAIKAVDPSAVVLSGGLAPADDTATTYSPETFLADMYADGAKGSFDGVGDHPYSFPAAPDTFENWSAWSQMDATSTSLRSIMTANGDSAKKIWITEYGAPTIGPVAITETAQSQELVQAITQVKQVSYIGSFYIYTFQDVAAVGEVNDGYGVLTDNNIEKPSYAAVKAALPAP
jgi:polysaccharide biosynthesis protein PslG